MPLELLDDEPLGAGLARVMINGVDLALVAVEAPPTPETVHTARRTLKVVRAGLRLVAPALDHRAFAVENHALRDAARPLSTVRDAEVAVDVLAGLRRHFRGEVAAETFSAATKWVARRRTEAARPSAGGFAQIAAELRLVRSRIADWPLDDVGWPAVSQGLTDVYAAGRRSMKHALAHPGDEAMHEWRKRVKDHRHQLELLKSLWSDVMPVLASAARTLGTHLGDDHDLAVLSQMLDGDAEVAIPAADRQAVSAAIARRRQTLQRHAARLGRCVYAERAQHFARRMGQYWKAGR